MRSLFHHRKRTTGQQDSVDLPRPVPEQGSHESSGESNRIPSSASEVPRAAPEDICDELNRLKERCPSLTAEATSLRPHGFVVARSHRMTGREIPRPQTPSEEFEFVKRFIIYCIESDASQQIQEPFLGTAYKMAYHAFKEQEYWKSLRYCSIVCSDFFACIARGIGPNESETVHYKHEILPRAVLYWKASMLENVILPFRERAGNMFYRNASRLYETDIDDVFRRILGVEYPLPYTQDKHDLSILESRRFFDDVLEEEAFRITMCGDAFDPETTETTYMKAGFIEASEELLLWRKKYEREKYNYK
ncbi:MAG: hypothetical protein Q9222_006306, partial [Ikaeria aurantiellina]